MKIVIDECLPKKIISLFPDHETQTVPQLGLSGYKDSQLLDELDKRGIDVFITIDGNIEYQQNFIDRKFGTIVIRSITNRFEDLLCIKNELHDAIEKKASGEILHIVNYSRK